MNSILEDKRVNNAMGEKNNVIVETETRYIEEQSSAEDNKYVFAYTITITNMGNIPARLMTRYWLITDANGKKQEVNGDGVVGEQPYLKPGETFKYTSGAMIETPVGVMEGRYAMVSDEDDNFYATVSPFTLSIPRVLH